jgi:hypothetical protein
VLALIDTLYSEFCVTKGRRGSAAST